MCGELGDALPEDERPKTAAYPTLDDPFATPDVEGIEAILKKAGIKTVYRETYTIDTKNFDAIASAIKSANPDLVVHGATFEDGVGLIRALRKAGFTPKMLYQTDAPSFGDQYSRRSARRTPRASSTPSATRRRPTRRATRSSWPSTRRCSAATEVPEDAADAFAAARGAAGGGRGERDVETTSSSSSPTGCAPTRSTRSSAPLSWNEHGSPKGEFLVGQWQERRAGDRAAGGGGHLGQDHPEGGRRLRVADRRKP